MNNQQLTEIINTLQQDGKEVKFTVLKSQVNQKRKMLFRGQKSCN